MYLRLDPGLPLERCASVEPGVSTYSVSGRSIIYQQCADNTMPKMGRFVHYRLVRVADE
jgi:hypothetical protein